MVVWDARVPLGSEEEVKDAAAGERPDCLFNTWVVPTFLTVIMLVQPDILM